MSEQNIVTTREPFLQPPIDKHYVRSFLFSRRINAPLAQVHLLARVLLVLCLSGVQLRAINAAHPDPIGACILGVVSLLLFIGSGMHKRVARIYLLLIFPALFSLFTTWLLFYPIPGHITLLRYQIYAGHIALGFAVWQGIWLIIAGGYYLWTRKLLNAILLATLVTLLLSFFPPLPAWMPLTIPFYHPLTILISDRGLVVAITKVIGYAGMVLATISLVVTSRDIELIGALRQLRIPQPIVFFLSTVFRALDLAISDYTIIHQAQKARAIDARPRSFIKRLRDLGSIAVPMVAIMIRRSSEMGDALYARGYRLGQNSANFYETAPWRAIDWLVLLVCIGMLVLTFGPYPDLTVLLLHWS